MSVSPIRHVAIRAAPLAGRSIVYGADVVADAFVAALHSFGALERIELLGASAEISGMRATIRRLDPSASRTTLATRFLNGLAVTPQIAGKWDVFHDPRPHGDCRSLFNIRERSGKAFPVTMTHHSLAYPSYLNEFFLPLLLSTNRTCDAVICASRASRVAMVRTLECVAEELAASTGAQLTFKGELPVIPLGVDIDRFRPRDRALLRASLGLPADDIVLLYLGRLSAYDKGDLAPLLRVVADLAADDDMPRVTLIIAGTPFEDTSVHLKQRVFELGLGDKVRFVDVVDPYDAHMWYAAADVYISLADCIYETFGITPVEAMACGVPQIVSDWSGYRDTVAEGETGFLIPTRWMGADESLTLEAELLGDSWEVPFKIAQTTVVDVDVLRERLSWLVRDAELRHRMAENSRRRAIEQFSWQVVVQAHVQLWEHLGEMAARDASVPRPTSLIRPQYDACYGHYSTAALSAETLVSTTPGSDRDRAGNVVRPMAAIRGYIDESVLLSVKELLESATTRGARGLTVVEICAALKAHDSEAASRIRRHIMWMAKQGLAGLSEADGRPE